MKKFISSSIFLLALLISCQKLAWINPYDPGCPKEIWTPTDFKVVQEGQTIKLTWTQTNNQIDGFKIERTVDGVKTNVPPITITRDFNQYIDNSISGGKVHSYNLVAYAGNNQSNGVTAQVTPILAAGGVTTTAAFTVTAISASAGGVITSDGGSPVTARGLCWSTVSSPTIAGSKSLDGSGTGTFTSNLTGLSPNTTYFFRAYAINSVGTSYGNELSIKTVNGIPIVTTANISNITATTAISGGSIISDGGAAITTRGVCWATANNPTISGSKTADGSGIGTYASTISGLTPNTTYFVRAYVTNSVGTIYGNEVTLKTPLAPILFNSTKTYGTVSDIDGNTYKTIQIGTQLWMAENLKTTKYKDGNAIPLVTDNISWSKLTTPGYSWYNNDITTYKEVYGAFYNWYSLNTNNLCPTGWHVPTETDWTLMTTYLGGRAGTSGKLKETGIMHWNTPNTSATNESGFTALPGGYRNIDGTFYIMGNNGYWWSLTEYSGTIAWMRYMDFNTADIGLSSYSSKQSGFSVRCIYGDLIAPSLTTIPISGITTSSAASGGNITSDGGTIISERGICWSTTTNPTISNTRTSDGTGSGTFTSNLTGLSINTTYYARAYATYSAGTVYGNEISFTTDPIETIAISINFNDKPITLYSGLAGDGPYQINGYTYPYLTIVLGLEGTLNFTYHTAVVQNNSGSMTNPIWWGLGSIGGEEVDLGLVSGLGSIVTKPTTGWLPNRAILVGHGYVVRYKKSKDLTTSSLPYLYTRIYVVDLLKNSTGVTIGVMLKYGMSF